MSNDISIIVVAAGKGLRMGGEQPKQFLLLSGQPLLCHTLEALYNILPDAEIILVLHPDFVNYWRGECDKYGVTVPHKIVAGGAERFDSVKNGVDSVSPNSKYILIHDGVRPFVSSELVGRVVEQLKNCEAVIPVAPLVDSLREVEGDSSKVVDRARFVAVQTPQGFHSKVIREAYEQPFNKNFTDDASVVESNGVSINCVAGERNNIKITTKEDIAFAQFLLKS